MAEENYIDYHEEIGSFEIKSTREKLVDSEPQKLKEEYLKTGIEKEALFVLPIEDWTEEKLQQALQQKRENYIPFFKE